MRSDSTNTIPELITDTPADVSAGVVAYIAESYPGVMTFLEREIVALVRQGWDVSVFSLQGPAEIRYAAETARYPVRVEYCLNRHLFSARMIRAHLWLLWRRPWAYLGAISFALRGAGFSWYTLSRVIYTILKAGYFYETARALEIQHLHVHFAGRAADVALFLSQFLDIGFSFTGHSNDVIGDYPLLREKIHRARFVVASTERARGAIIARLSSGASRDVRLIRTGIDFDTFQPGTKSRVDSPLIVSVGRLVESKGLSDLVAACGILRRRGEQFRCLIVGDGAARRGLEDAIEREQLVGSVTLLGPAPSTEIVELMQEAWVFALPCVKVAGGRQDHLARFVPVVEDGIPVSLIEAMAVELPVVTTAVGAIPELVEDWVTGLVVGEREPAALADALSRLLADPSLRRRMGQAARARVASEFDSMLCVRPLGELIHAAISEHHERSL